MLADPYVVVADVVTAYVVAPFGLKLHAPLLRKTVQCSL